MMDASIKDFLREPSHTHQCMYLYEDGRRCRAQSMHNEYRCFRHRENYMPPVIENEPFEIAALDDRAAIQKALSQLAARLACNRIDLKRAGLLAYTLQTASTNLADPRTEVPQPPADLPGIPDPPAPHRPAPRRCTLPLSRSRAPSLIRPDGPHDRENPRSHPRTHPHRSHHLPRPGDPYGHLEAQRSPVHNPAQSHQEPPSSPMATAGDSIKVTTEGIAPNGQPERTEWTGKFDGKDYPLTGSSGADTRAYTRVNDRTLTLTNKKAGKEISTGRVVVSADGKSRVLTLTSTDASGQKVYSTAIYNKQ